MMSLLSWTCGSSDPTVGSSAPLGGDRGWQSCGHSGVDSQPSWASSREWWWVQSGETSPGIGSGFALHLVLNETCNYLSLSSINKGQASPEGNSDLSCGKPCSTGEGAHLGS